MERHVARTLKAIRWSARDVREFTGRLLTEPKAQVYFKRPIKPLSRTAFVRQGMQRGLALDSGSRLGFSGTMFFVNGAATRVSATARATMRRLADSRRLSPPLKAPPAFWEVAHGWYLEGVLHLDGEAR
jgi:50S ribosomal protein L16 3-hydroxylase